MSGMLALMRHGESEWNRLGRFTGWANPGLTEKGGGEMRRAAQLFRRLGLKFDIAFTSCLARAEVSLSIVLQELGNPGLPVIRDRALNERYYGELTGLTKDDARARWGDAQVLFWRRAYDGVPPGGESIEDTAHRVLPYYHDKIFSRLRRGDGVIVVTHVAPFLALTMELERLTPDKIVMIEPKNAQLAIYRFNVETNIFDKIE